jgi:outer membrane protein assembly factor BamE (lipoprotein component of BamABCDE complex)
MRQRRLYLSLIFVLLFSGCMTVGRDFASAPVNTIEINKTSQREIFSYFGEPYRKGIENGYETWSYLYNYWELGQLKDSKELTVAFNKDQTVRSYSYNAR